MGIDLRDVDQPIGTLSGGERQCVAIARAVYFGARVLILDEPTAALGVRQSGVVLKYIAKARDRGLGVIFITHNPHHAYPVGDRFMLLRRGRSMGNFPKAEMTLDELVQMMAGGAELEALSHELAREMPDSELAKAMEEEVSETTSRAPSPPTPTRPREAEQPEVRTETLEHRGRRRRVRLDGAGARPRLGPPAPALPGQLRCGPGSWPSRTRTRHVATRPVGVRLRAGVRRLGRAARARRHRRRQRVRAELRAPRDRRRRSRRPGGTSGSRSRPAGDLADTAAIAEAVRKAGVHVGGRASTTATPRPSSWPASWSSSGRLGEVETVTVRLLADYSAHPDGALSWRFDPEYAGTGVLGDLASHGFDLARHVGGQQAGRITELVADQATFITERPSRDRGGLALRSTAGTGHAVRSATRTRFRRCCASSPGRTGTSSPRASPSASSAATASRSVAPAARSRWDFRRMGELAGLSRPGLPGRRVADAPRRDRATASWAPSSPGQA